MENHREKGSTRRTEETRGDHTRETQRRKEHKAVDNDQRKVVDQRTGYQRKSNRRSGTERRN